MPLLFSISLSMVGVAKDVNFVSKSYFAVKSAMIKGRNNDKNNNTKRRDFFFFS